MKLCVEIENGFLDCIVLVDLIIYFFGMCSWVIVLVCSGLKVRLLLCLSVIDEIIVKFMLKFLEDCVFVLCLKGCVRFFRFFRLFVSIVLFLFLIRMCVLLVLVLRCIVVLCLYFKVLLIRLLMVWCRVSG